MGQFTSFCPNCNEKIYWFLDAPKDFVCNCGRKVSEKEIEDSWDDYYFRDLEMNMKSDLIISIHRRDALELDLLACKCGHTIINHHGYYKNCIHADCDCKEYDEVVRMGKMLSGITYFPKDDEEDHER